MVETLQQLALIEHRTDTTFGYHPSFGNLLKGERLLGLFVFDFPNLI